MTAHVISVPLAETTASPSFDAFYRAAHPRLVRAMLVRSRGDAELAADAVDEAMVRAYERWNRVGSMESTEAWVYRVAANQLKRTFRRRIGERRALSRTTPVSEAHELAVPAPIWDAVQQLSGRQRDAVVCRYVLGFTEREIAEALGVKEGTASALLSRARASLRDVLTAEAGGDPS